ncbi:MAG: hypothetical protein O2904_02090 [bacterium]|nr:hypothetical protein [bacterium]
MSTADILPEAEPTIDSNEWSGPAPLLPTPERVSQFLEMDIETVRTMFINVNERAGLVDRIIAEQDALANVHNNITHEEISALVNIAGERLALNPTMDLEELEFTLHEARSTFAANSHFLEASSPHALDSGEAKAAVLEKVTDSKVKAETTEERSLWAKAWDVITYMPRKHPVITALIALAAAGWGIYALWDYLGEAIVIPNPMDGAADVANELVAPVGGEFGAINDGGIVPPNLDIPDPGAPTYDPGAGTPDVFASPQTPDVPTPTVNPKISDLYPDGPN